MKFHAAATASLLVGMPIGVSAARNGVSVTENDIDFDVAYFDEGRSRPYRVVFWEDARNLFDFDPSGNVQVMRIGNERYRVLYTPTGGIKRVTLKSFDRRALTGAHYEDEEKTEKHGDQQPFMANSRRLYSCDECEDTWSIVCGAGVPSVCNLVDYGSPFSREASDAVQVMCDTFGDACSGSLGHEVCDGQCVSDDDDVGGDDDGNDDDEGDDDSGGGGLNPCLDPASELYKCNYQVGNPRILLTDCGLVDDDLPYLPGCFDNFGKTNILFLYFTFSIEPSTNVLSTFPEDTFAGLTEVLELNLGQQGLTSLPAGLFSDMSKVTSLALFYNNLTTLPTGVFSGLVGVKYIYLYENFFATLPDRIFEGLSSLKLVNLDENDLVSLPAGTFAGMGGPSFTLLISGNDLTSLPDGLFIDIPRMDSLIIERNTGLQCIPAVQGAGISYYLADPELGDIYNNGICECSPEEAIMCEAGTTCEPGAKGYTCVD